MPNKGEPITTKFSVDISELKAGIQEANRQIKLANSQFKAASSGMDDWANSVDGLQAKIEQLTSVQDAENKKLENLQKQYNLVAAEMGENSKAAQDLQIKVNNQQAAVNKTTAELGRYQGKLDDLRQAQNRAEEATEDTRTTYEKLKDTISDQEKALADLKGAYTNVALEQGDNSDAAKNLADEIESLSSELNDNKKKMSDAESSADSFDKSLDDLGDSAEEAEGGFTILKGAISTFAGNVLTAAAGKVVEFGKSILGLSESTREYRGEMAKLDSAAQNNGYSVDYAKSKYQDLYGVLADETAANTTISNFMAMGASTETLDSLLNSSMGIWAQYGDSIPLDGLAEAVNETVRVGTVTGTLADALNWAGISEDEFNEKLEACTNEQERQKLVVETLDATYGDLAKSYQENNSSVIEANKANAEYTDTIAEMGRRVEPVTTAIRKGFTKILKKGLELTGGLNFDKLAANIEKGFSEFVDDILPKVVDGFNWIVDNKDLLIGAISAIAGGFAAFKAATIVSSLVGWFKNLFLIMQTGTPIMAALNTVMAANPIGIIITLIGGLVAAFVTLWNTSDSFRAFWMGVWDSIKSYCGIVIDAIVQFFTVTVPQAIDNMVTFFQELPGRIQTFLTQAIEFVRQWVSEMVQKAIETGTEFLTNVINFIAQLPEKIAYWLGFALGKVISWGQQLIQFALTEIPNWINAMITFISELPGKFWTWLTNTLNNVIKWGINLVNTGRQKATEFINGVIEFIQTLPTKISEWLTKAVENTIQWGADMVREAVNAAQKLVDDFVTKISELPGKVLEVGKNIVTSIWEGISSMGGWLMDKLSGWIDDIIDSFMDGKDDGKKKKSKKKSSGGSSGPATGPGRAVAAIATNTREAVSAVATRARTATAAMMRNMGLEAGKDALSSQVAGVRRKVAGAARTAAQKVQEVKNVTFNQYNTSPKALSRLEIYRQSKNLLKGVTIDV